MFNDHERSVSEARARAMETPVRSVGDPFPGCSINDLPVAVLVFAQGRVVSANAKWTALTGLDQASSLRDGWLRAVRPRDRSTVTAALKRGGAGLEVAVDWCLAGSSPAKWNSARIGPMGEGEPGRCVMTVIETDQTGSHGDAELLERATKDSLTGLLTRAAFMAEVESALERGAPADPGRCAVLFVDLDHFKDVNDRLGHQIGDLVLVAACRRIQSVLRLTDTLGRLGGDEVAVLCPTLEAPEEAVRLAERIVQTTVAPFTIGDDLVHLGASVGVALSDIGDCTAKDLVHHADRAMYRAKAEGRGRLSVFGAHGPQQRDHESEAHTAMAEASKAVGRAQRQIRDLWRDAVGLQDHALSVTLVDAGHALQTANRLLGRDVTALPSVFNTTSSPACSPGGRHRRDGADAPDPGTASDRRSTTVRDVAVAASGDANTVPLPGGARVDDGEPFVVWLWGEHDLATVDAVSLALAAAIAADGDVVVDLAALTFMDASILVLLTRSRQAVVARGGRLSVRSSNSSVRRLLEICDLTYLIEAETSGAADVRGARSALETWIEVPPAGAATAPVPAAVIPPVPPASSRGDPEETRR